MFAVRARVLAWAKVCSTSLCPSQTGQWVGYRNFPALQVRAMTAQMLNVHIGELLQSVRYHIAALPHALSSRHYDALGPADDENVHQARAQILLSLS